MKNPEPENKAPHADVESAVKSIRHRRDTYSRPRQQRITLRPESHAAKRGEEGRLNNVKDLTEAIVEGAALRMRPIAMTVAVIIAGLLPIMWGSGTGSEVMRRIAAPMVGGMITAPLLSMFVIPALYLLLRRRRVAP